MKIGYVGTLGNNSNYVCGVQVQGNNIGIPYPASGFDSWALDVTPAYGKHAIRVHKVNGTLYLKPTYDDTTGNGANMYIHSDGSVYRSTSSREYKTDIKDYKTKGLAEVLKLRPVSFKGKKGQIDENTKNIGFIAEELEDIGLSDLVSKNSDNEVEGINYQGLISVLCTAIQEISSKYDSLETKYDTLEARVKTLEG